MVLAPLVAGLSLAGLAYGARFAVLAFKKYRALPQAIITKHYIKNGFLKEMTRGEAAQILGVRHSASVDKIKAAHRKLMIINHPDHGGSEYLAFKVNEAKDLLLKDHMP